MYIVYSENDIYVFRDIYGLFVNQTSPLLWLMRLIVLTTEKQSSDKIVLRRPNLRQRSDIKYQRDSKAALVVQSSHSHRLFQYKSISYPKTKRYSDLLLHVVPLSPLLCSTRHVTPCPQCHQPVSPGGDTRDQSEPRCQAGAGHTGCQGDGQETTSCAARYGK